MLPPSDGSRDGGAGWQEGRGRAIASWGAKIETQTPVCGEEGWAKLSNECPGKSDESGADEGVSEATKPVATHWAQDRKRALQTLGTRAITPNSVRKNGYR